MHHYWFVLHKAVGLQCSDAVVVLGYSTVNNNMSDGRVTALLVSSKGRVLNHDTKCFEWQVVVKETVTRVYGV